ASPPQQEQEQPPASPPQQKQGTAQLAGEPSLDDGLSQAREPIAHVIGQGEINWGAQGGLVPPDKRGVRKVVKDYVGPNSPGTITMGPSLVGRPGLDDDVKADLTARYEALLEKRGKLIHRDRDIDQVIEWGKEIKRGEEEGVTVTEGAALDIVRSVRREWKL